MLPPHPPFVQKIVKRRIVRRGPREALVEIAEGSDAGREGERVWRRAPRRLKPALKVLEQPRTGAQG
jgi:hypothetical protein